MFTRVCILRYLTLGSLENTPGFGGKEAFRFSDAEIAAMEGKYIDMLLQ